MISKRLKSLANHAKDSMFILDVGCDHGLLSIHLAQAGKKLIASDIAKEPLEVARRNIKRAGLDNIQVVLAPGLKAIDEKVDTVIIAGMGNATMQNIIEEDYHLLKSVNKLIVSPHTEVADFRKYITNKGFYITDEEVVYDKGKYYTIIVLEKGSRSYSEKELFLGPVLMKEKTKTYLEYCQQELLNKRKILDKYDAKNKELIEEVKRLEELINS